MDVAITGSHGLIGRALSRALQNDGHRVRAVVRGRATSSTDISYDPDHASVDHAALSGADAIVNLAGAPIATGLLTKAGRDAVRSSRLAITRALAEAVDRLDRKPAVFVSGSAVGYYGAHRGDEELVETSEPGDDFLAQTCVAWETAATRAAEAGVRVACIRTAMVLAPDGGALKPQLPLYKLGLGGPSGDGNQWMSWIAIDDEVAAIQFLLEHDISGAVNLSAPSPVRNGDFAARLGRAVGRPAKLRVPAMLRKLPAGAGDLIDNLLLASQRVIPKVLYDNGFEFTHPDLTGALHTMVGGHER